jgi:hypothetical protein
MRFSTLTAGGHHGPDVSAIERPDGVVLRLTQGGEHIEVFLNLACCDNLGGLLTGTVAAAKRQQASNRRN